MIKTRVEMIILIKRKEGKSLPTKVILEQKQKDMNSSSF